MGLGGGSLVKGSGNKGKSLYVQNQDSWVQRVTSTLDLYSDLFGKMVHSIGISAIIR